jgi:hypothetical protein
MYADLWRARRRRSNRQRRRGRGRDLGITSSNTTVIRLNIPLSLDSIRISYENLTIPLFYHADP